MEESEYFQLRGIYFNNVKMRLQCEQKICTIHGVKLL